MKSDDYTEDVADEPSFGSHACSIAVILVLLFRL